MKEPEVKYFKGNSMVPFYKLQENIWYGYIGNDTWQPSTQIHGAWQARLPYPTIGKEITKEEAFTEILCVE